MPVKIYGKHIWMKVIEPVNFIHVCFQSAPVNLLTHEIFLDFDWLGWARLLKFISFISEG